MKRELTFALAFFVAGLSYHAARHSAAAEDAGAKQAVAEIHGAGKNAAKIHGMITFTPEANGIRIAGDVEGLPPGKHGIHIHEKNDLSKPDLSGAGGHFNPGGAGHKHSGPDDPSRHAGDLGNLVADENGHAHLELTVAENVLSIDGRKNGVVGHSVIIHEKEDDLKGQPAGNSGARIAGGKIELKGAEADQPKPEK